MSVVEKLRTAPQARLLSGGLWTAIQPSTAVAQRPDMNHDAQGFISSGGKISLAPRAFDTKRTRQSRLQ